MHFSMVFCIDSLKRACLLKHKHQTWLKSFFYFSLAHSLERNDCVKISDRVESAGVFGATTVTKSTAPSFRIRHAFDGVPTTCANIGAHLRADLTSAYTWKVHGVCWQHFRWGLPAISQNRRAVVDTCSFASDTHTCAHARALRCVRLFFCFWHVTVNRKFKQRANMLINIPLGRWHSGARNQKHTDVINRWFRDCHSAGACGSCVCEHWRNGPYIIDRCPPVCFDQVTGRDEWVAPCRWARVKVTCLFSVWLVVG